MWIAWNVDLAQGTVFRAVARMWKTRRQRSGSGDRVPQQGPGAEPQWGV